jgi:ubiquinone/menaquinone biosynthesis C-methylase UbiE
MIQQDIRVFFDTFSVDRDKRMAEQPRLRFEASQRKDAVMALLQPTVGDLILDIGCGNARDIREFLHCACHSVGVDISFGMLMDGKQRIAEHPGPGTADLMKGDALVLPFADNTFDKIVCSEVIEHIPRWRDGLAEMVRVLKPGGTIVITTPNIEGIYGFWHNTVDAAARHAKELMGKGNHPYDEWKRQHEVIAVLVQNGCRISDAMGVCFYPLPSALGYRLPPSLAEVTIAPVRRIEPQLQRRFPRGGYMMAVAAEKL